MFYLTRVCGAFSSGGVDSGSVGYEKYFRIKDNYEKNRYTQTAGLLTPTVTKYSDFLLVRFRMTIGRSQHSPRSGHHTNHLLYKFCHVKKVRESPVKTSRTTYICSETRVFYVYSQFPTLKNERSSNIMWIFKYQIKIIDLKMGNHEESHFVEKETYSELKVPLKC